MLKKLILIAGYYGFENIGDDAILSSILFNLRGQRRNLEFIVISGNPKQTSEQYKVRSVLWTDIPAIMDACQESDLILLGGGGLFHDYWGTTEEHVLTQSHSGISFYSGFPILAKLYNKPCILFSLGVGPLLTEAGKKLTKQSFENAVIATVRDVESLNLLHDLGVNTNHVNVTADSVFSLKSDFEKSDTIIKAIKKDASPLIAVGLRHWTVENASNNWQKEIASALDSFAEKYNASFLFLPFQISPDNPLTDDLTASQKVIALMKHADKVKIFQENVTPEIISGIISQCDFVFGMRLHSLIFAVKEAVPFVGLVYDPKVENLIHAVNMQEFAIKMEEINAEKLLEVLDNAWRKRAETKKTLTQKSKQLKELANENIKLVLSQLDTPFHDSEMNTPDLQKLLIKQTRKLAESEKTAHTLWLQTQESNNQTTKPVQMRKDRLTYFEPSPAQLKSYRPDIICFSIIDWEFRYQRPQQIMSQFAEQGHRVFYINPSHFQPINDSIHILPIKENIFEIRLSAHHVPELYSENVKEKNLEAMLNSLEELKSKLEIQEAMSYVMISSWEQVALEARRRWGWQIIYDCMDEWDNFPLVKPPIIEAEIRLVRDCDLLVVTSQTLFEKWNSPNRPMILARNAADYDFYQQHYLPNNLLADVKHPIVGYYGAIADWFDLELMTYIAKNRPNYTFVLLGGIFDLDVSELNALPNVMLLGQQPYERMPQYLYHFDVCIIPFKINAITEATDPVKIYEYMCGGKPVVSVTLSELKAYQELLYLAENKEDFVRKLDQALAEENLDLRTQRKFFAQQNTWRKRVLAINDELSRLSSLKINTETPFPLILPKETIISSRILAKHNNLDYWQVVYENENLIYKQMTLNLAEREFHFLSQLHSDYFPKPLEIRIEEGFSIITYPRIEGNTLQSSVNKINSSSSDFYIFIDHCLNLLQELKNNRIVHRDIQHANILVKNGKPILTNMCWAVVEDEIFFSPFGLGGSERPTNGAFSDIYSMGKILDYINQHKYSNFDIVISLMTAQETSMRINDLDTLKTLFQLAYLNTKRGEKVIDSLPNAHIVIDGLQKIIMKMLEQILSRNKKIKDYISLKNQQGEKIFLLKKSKDDLNLQLTDVMLHAEGLSMLVDQKEKELQNILNSKSWKVAQRLQRIYSFFSFKRKSKRYYGEN